MVDEMGGRHRRLRQRHWVPACAFSDEDARRQRGSRFEELNKILQFSAAVTIRDGAVPFRRKAPDGRTEPLHGLQRDTSFDLWLKYSVEGGRHLMDMDPIVVGMR